MGGYPNKARLADDLLGPAWLSLLDRGQLPRTTCLAGERPKLGRLRRAVRVAGYNGAAGPVTHNIDAFVTKSDGGIIRIPFAPSL
jgi:hypothetical protein